MKKLFLFLLPLVLILLPKDTYAQQIQNTGVTLKNSTNTSVLYSGGINEDQTNIAYVTGKVEFPFSTSVAYDSSYSFTMDYYFNVPYTSDHSSFGWGNPELYINSNGLVQQGLQISSFSNTLQACNVLACTYRLNLAFTFATNAGGTLYLAIPVSPPHAIYGWHYNNIDLTSYGQNTSNSDIINNNNQNTQNIINSQNNNTQQIINSQNSISNEIIDDTAPNSEEISNFFDTINMVSFGPISGILQIPLRILGHFQEEVNNTCSPVTLGRLYGHDITMTCIDIESLVGTNLYNMMDILIAFFCYYELFMYIIHIYDKFTNLTDDFNELYRKGAIH